MASPNPPVLPESGSGRFLVGHEVLAGTWGPQHWLASYERLIALEDGRELTVSDADQRLGFIYQAPDSGREMTNMMVCLDPAEPDPDVYALPGAHQLQLTSFDAMRPIFASVAAGETHSDDLDWCRQLFNSLPCLFRSIQQHGTLEAARAAILRDLFCIT